MMKDEVIQKKSAQQHLEDIVVFKNTSTSRRRYPREDSITSENALMKKVAMLKNIGSQESHTTIEDATRHKKSVTRSRIR